MMNKYIMHERMKVFSSAIVCVSLLLFLLSVNVEAAWMAHSDFSACPRKYVPQSSGKEGPFSTESQCRARLSAAAKGNAMACAKYYCTEEGTSASGSGGPVSSDGTSNMIDGFVKGNSQQFMKGLFQNMLQSKPQNNTPAAPVQRGTDDAQAAEQRRQADEQAAQRRRQAEEESARQAAEKNRQAEESRDRLLGKNADPSGLSLMGVDSSSDLKLMSGDQQPNATDGDSSSGLQLMGSDQQPNASDRNKSSDKKRSRAKAYGYTKGFEHASQCFSQNISVCNGAPADQQNTCIDDYRAGYASGDKRRAMVMNEAFRIGEKAGSEDKPNNSFNDPRADGPCRVQWVETYNRGHFQGKQSRAQR